MSWADAATRMWMRILLRRWGRGVVRANITAAGSKETGVFNIGSGEAVTINELAEVIMKLCGKNIEVVHVEPREGDIMHSQSSVEMARRMSFVPEYGLKEGLREMVGWFQKH